MFFASLEFLLFFTALFFIFFFSPLKIRSAILLLASLLFIAFFSPSFLVYAILFSFVNFWIALMVNKEKNSKKRKNIFIGGQVFNIGGLVLFKYLSFIVENVLFILGIEASDFGVIGRIALPLGISYYTFQGISYLYLVYKAKDQPEKNFLNLTLYMLYFPKIMAGPIERHRKFLPQINLSGFKFDHQRVVEGGQLVMWGMFKKLVIGDTLGIVVNKVYADVEQFQGVPLIITFIIQPLQLYFDFSGYTDMALGFSRIFGIQLTDNFRRPFFAQTVGDFWRRWHITLSSWCNDFIYNRLLLKHRKWGNKAAVYAVFSSFLVIGIWHGANWTFVVLGILQGIALTYEFFTKRKRVKWNKLVPSFVYKWGSRSLVYIFFSVSLVFFFSQSMGDAIHFFRFLPQIQGLDNTHYGFNIVRWEAGVALSTALLFLIFEWMIEDKGLQLREWFNRLRWGYRWGIYFFWLFVVVYFSKNQMVFVYAEF